MGQVLSITPRPTIVYARCRIGTGGLALFLIIALLKKKYELINFQNKAHTPQNVELAEQPGRV